jgi:hypothetical protein
MTLGGAVSIANVPERSGCRQWRSYFRFSVRGLIVLVLVTGGWMGWIVRGARIQREAVAAIEKAGGSVGYDGESNDPTYTLIGKPRIRRPLGDLIGIDYFGRVTYVWLRNPTDATIAQVGRLSHVQEFDI